VKLNLARIPPFAAVAWPLAVAVGVMAGLVTEVGCFRLQFFLPLELGSSRVPGHPIFEGLRPVTIFFGIPGSRPGMT
jgi:hypothetical protein